MKSHISCIYLTFSNVCFQMLPQIDCIVPPVTFYSLCVLNVSQVSCPSGCKITLAALVCSFSGVCFQIFPQTVYPGGCVIILFTSVWFFSNVSNVYSNAPHERIHSHIGCICFSSVCVFKFCMCIWNVLKCKVIKILNPKHIWKVKSNHCNRF